MCRGTTPPLPSDDLHTPKKRRHHIHTQMDADAAESRYQEFVRRSITCDSEKKRQSVNQSVSQLQITVFIMLMTIR